MLRNLLLVVAVLVVSSGAWAESNQSHNDSNSTPEDKACRGDAHRFCKEDIPDQFRVASCLQEHRDRLSHACRSVLEGHGM